MNQQAIPRATHDGPLDMAGWVLHSYVLDDGRRVLSGRGFMAAFDIRSKANGIAPRLEKILNEHIMHPLIYQDILAPLQNPIRFKDTNNRIAIGYQAEFLIQFCEVFLKARERIAIRTQVGQRYARVAEALVRAAAKVGIVALIDEVTGYQAVRDRDALQRLLGNYIRADLAEWAKTFPDEFYDQIGRLKDWKSLVAGKRPGVVGHITNDVIYARLAPGIIRELQRRNPRLPGGGRDHKHHQHLTDDTGYPELRALLTGVVALMRASTTWGGFERLLERSYPKFNDTLPLLLVDKDGDPV